ncbi:hypothetical protein [Dyadobacter sp. CY326]|uniref:hypothetical protein n=1 Tax=Dyadobacter sp. CY326 TaxID=2907300 RepID=UPI001F3AB4E1|nr:hypothetical protein [Dyadobacter sp. CY326]MCE7065684.1 hypothetical protein [Dyadobacter sp. CY326]
MILKLRLILQMLFLMSCHELSHPDVDTLYIDGKDREESRADAINTLYDHYMNSTKEKEVYEVIARGNGRFIINYVPELKLLTLCGDPGSGWGPQFKEVDEAALQRLINDKITFDDLHGVGSIGSAFDSVLVRNNPMYSVKTNGYPSI